MSTILKKYEIGEELGRGDNAVVYEIKEKKTGQECALKVIEFKKDRNTTKKEEKEFYTALDNEIAIQKEAATLGCAPEIFEDESDFQHENITGKRALVMEKIQPLSEFVKGGKALSQQIQQDYVQRTWILVKNGIIHNDLHQGNVGVRKEGTKYRGVIFDFGFAERIPIVQNLVILRQLLVSQLYSLLTMENCNENNTYKFLCGKKKPIHIAIYNVKAHTLKDIKELEKVLGVEKGVKDVTEKMEELTVEKANSSKPTHTVTTSSKILHLKI